MTLLQNIFEYLTTTPFPILAAQALIVIGWVPIAGAMIWGLLELWVDARQGKYWSEIKWQLLNIHIPQGSIQTPKGMENFFNNLAGSKSSITWKEQWLNGKFQSYFSLEIVSHGGNIEFYIRTPDKTRDLVEAALYAQYPEAQITEVEDYAKDFPDEYPNDTYDSWGSNIVLAKPSFYPLRTYSDFEHMGEADQRFKDPLLSMIEALGKMRPNEIYAIQILIMNPDSQDAWIKPGLKYLNEKMGRVEKKKQGFIEGSVGWIPGEFLNQITGSAFGLGGDAAKAEADPWAAFRMTPAEQDLMKSVGRKVSKLGWWTKIRFVYIATHDSFRKGTIAAMSKGIFHPYGDLNSNKFGLYDAATPKDDYPWLKWSMPGRQRKLIKAFKNRSMGAGPNVYALNSEELATLFHFPAADARTPVLSATGARRSEAPRELAVAGMDVDPIIAEAPKTASSAPLTPKPLVVPHPTSPTAQVSSVPSTPIDTAFDAKPIAISVPQPRPIVQQRQGVPAPLPPGVDAPRNTNASGDVPPNLPI